MFAIKNRLSCEAKSDLSGEDTHFHKGIGPRMMSSYEFFASEPRFSLPEASRGSHFSKLRMVAVSSRLDLASYLYRKFLGFSHFEKNLVLHRIIFVPKIWRDKITYV